MIKYRALLGCYYRERTVRILIALLVYAGTFFFVSPVIPVSQVPTVGDYVFETLGNQLVTYLGLPILLSVCYSDMYVWGYSGYQRMLMCRLGSARGLNRFFVLVVIVNSFATAILTVVFAAAAGILRGFALNLDLTTAVGLHEGVMAIPNRFVMVLVFATTFGLINLLIGMLVCKVAINVLTNVLMIGFLFANYKGSFGLLTTFPFYPGSGLFWGNYLNSSLPGLISITNVIWLLVAIIATSIVYQVRWCSQ